MSDTSSATKVVSVSLPMWAIRIMESMGPKIGTSVSNIARMATCDWLVQMTLRSQNGQVDMPRMIAAKELYGGIRGRVTARRAQQNEQLEQAAYAFLKGEEIPEVAFFSDFAHLDSGLSEDLANFGQYNQMRTELGLVKKLITIVIDSLQDHESFAKFRDSVEFEFDQLVEAQKKVEEQPEPEDETEEDTTEPEEEPDAPDEAPEVIEDEPEEQPEREGEDEEDWEEEDEDDGEIDVDDIFAGIDEVEAQ